VNLVDTACAQDFSDHLRKGYQEATGIDADVYLCHASSGAREVDV
jgi:galactokinase